MDRNVFAAQRLHDEQEAHNEGACLQEAARNGHTAEEAAACDDCSVDCVACPFRAKPTPDQLAVIRDYATEQMERLRHQLRLAGARYNRAANLYAESTSEFSVGDVITTDDYAKQGKAFRLSRIGHAGAGYTRLHGHSIRKNGEDHATERELFTWSAPWRRARPDEIPGGAK